MFKKQDKVYVDIGTNGKPLPLDVFTLCRKLKMNEGQMKKAVEQYRKTQAEAAEQLSNIIKALEDGMTKSKMLDDMRLEPWFKFGKTCVVRVEGARAKANGKATANTAADNVAALFS